MHPALESLDWEREGQAAIQLLQSLLRFETVNPPGNEAACIAFLAEAVRAAGAEPEVLRSAPGRANLVVRVRGTGAEPPLLLNGHVDVVAAEAGRWRHPPFAGLVADGDIWGRGAVDMKHMVAMSATVVGLLTRLGIRLRRDVIFAAVADEEDGCAAGSAWLVDNHPEKVRAAFALGEVGGFTMYFGGRPVYPIQVAEKGICWMRATASGPTGHGSIPHPDNAVVRLSRFLATVGDRRLPSHVAPVTRRFVRELAATQRRPVQAALRMVLEPRLSGLIVDKVLAGSDAGRSLDAVLRNTASPTVLRAGGKTNVLPSRAEAELDGRIAIGSSEAELLAELRRLAGPDIVLEVLRSMPPTETSPDTELFGVLAAVVADHHPGAVAVPSVTPGFTDAKYWSRLGTRCYGFSPVRLEPGDTSFRERFHGDDERVPVAGFVAGLQMLADAVLRFCGEAAPWRR